jgi:hypothetical protein
VYVLTRMRESVAQLYDGGRRKGRAYWAVMEVKGRHSKHVNIRRQGYKKCNASYQHEWVCSYSCSQLGKSLFSSLEFH